VRLPYFKFIAETADSQVPITFRMWWDQTVLGRHDGVYWPVHPTSVINEYQNVLIGLHTSPGYAAGCYIQGIGRVYIGDYTQIAQNVGIISANHDPHDNSVFLPKEVRIGSYCWIGMNAVILPGVELGDFTIVGAGSVVTKSFPEGYCVIAGNPAKVVRQLEPEKCVRFSYAHDYIGFHRKADFEKYRRNNLRL
jgi:acetyltransferase-like isoleucine patch superfamily enzyme